MSRPATHPFFRGPLQYVPGNALQLKVDAEAAVTRRPEDPAAWIDLGVACSTLSDARGMVAAALKAAELAPDDLVTLRFAAQCLNQTSPVDARIWYERIAALAPEDLSVLNQRYVVALMSEDYAEAAALCRTLDRIQPHTVSHHARLGRVLRLLGDSDGARHHFAHAAMLCADALCPFPLGPMASLAPVYTTLAGDRAGAERQSDEICRFEGIGLADLDHPRYPASWAETVAGARHRQRGRDLYIFGNGPSLVEVVGRCGAIAAHDFLSMTMSSFQLAEEDVLRPIGRSVDFVCMTHPSVVKDQSAAIRNLFARSPEAMLVLPLWVRELDAAEGGTNPLLRDRVVWYDCHAEHLGHPGEPLHVPPLNTLLCALAVAMLIEPRRIFLFGFDGRIKGDDSQNSESLYFKEHDPSYLTTARRIPEARELTRKWLLWDSLHFNEIAPHALRHAALLFDLDLPPIYNVCPGSALTPFPRVTFDRFLEIARDGKAAA